MSKKLKVITLVLILLAISSVTFGTNKVQAITVKDVYGSHTLTPGKTVKLGASVLTMNQNVFCRNGSQVQWKDQGTFKISELKTVSNNKTAYILAQNKFKDVSTKGYSESKQHTSVAQNAYWEILGQAKKTNNSTVLNNVKNLINRAQEFENYRKNFTNLSEVKTTIAKKTLSNGNTVIGPIKIKFSKTTNFGGITKVTVNGDINNKSKTLTSGTDYYLASKADGTSAITTPSSNTNFYIVIKPGRNITKVNSIHFEEKQSSLTVSYLNITRTTGNGQDLTVVEPKWDNKTKSLNLKINIALDVDVKLEFYKEDYNNNLIKDAQIKIEKSSNIDIAAKTLTSNEKGYFGQVTFKPTTNNGTFKINVTETKTPAGIVKLSDKIELTVKYNTATGKVESVTPNKDSDYFKITAGNIGKVVLKNDIEMANLIINKGIVDAKFTAVLDNVSEVTINKKFIDGSTPKFETYKATYTKNGNSFVIKANNSENKIKITNLVTKEMSSFVNSSGTHYKGIIFTNIKFAHKQTNLTVSLKETGAPSGYEVIKDTISVSFKAQKNGISKSGYSVNSSKVSKDEFDYSNVKNIKLSGSGTPYTISASSAATYSNIIKLRDLTKNPEIELQLRKVDKTAANVALSNAKLTILKDSNVASINGLTGNSVTSGTNGLFPKITIKPETNNGTVKIKIKEATPPKGYSLLNKGGEIVLTIKYNTKTGEVTSVEPDKVSSYINFDNGTLIIKNDKQEAPKTIELKLKKVDKENGGKGLQGAVLSIAKYSNISKLEGLTGGKITSGADGEFGTLTITPTSNNGTIKLRLTEATAPAGYSLLNEGQAITLTVKYNTTTYEVTSIEADKENEFFNWTSKTLEIKNEEEEKPIQLKLVKTDSVTGEILPNTEFKLEFTNVSELKAKADCIVGNNSNGDFVTIKDIANTVFKTDSEGVIFLKDIVLTKTEAKLKVTENKAPEAKDSSYYYEKIDKSVYFDIKQANNGIEVTGPYLEDGTTVTQGTITKEVKELVNSSVDNYIINVEFKNVPLMDLEGQVWIDGQNGIKGVKPANGNLDNGEKTVDGIPVYLFASVNGDLTSKEQKVTQDGGKYSFIGLESPRADYSGNRDLEGYVIKFEYNGIKFNDTVKGGKSKAFEVAEERSAFNKRFEKITKSESNDQTPLAYDYTSNNEIGISKLKGEINGNNPVSEEKNFKVRANTELCTRTDKNVDFGMIERFFDLRLDMVVNSALLTINEKETTYTYDEILKNQEKQNNNTDYKGDPIDLKLYDSDYNYRINDYAESPVQMAEEDLEDRTEIINKQDANKQLRAFVTYEVAIMNQSDVNAKVDELAYYYDNNYEFVSAKTADGKELEFKDDDSLPKIDGKTSAKVTGLAQNLGADNDYREVLYFTFEIKRNDDGTLPEKIAAEGIECANIVEIISYSTEQGGFIDDDSCPGNAQEQLKNNQLWEDDAYGAKALRVTVDKERIRTIEGNVFEDLNEDGNLNGENGINGVTVQLVEIRNIPDAEGNAKYREAIWQETVSGTNLVKIRNNVTGVTDAKYNNGVSGEGKYKFTGFIPGEYIVRFIYGDGLYKTYYYDEADDWKLKDYDSVDEKLLNNIKKYNGQDYKSTLKANYKEANYLDKVNGDNKSVAVDNEARRLDVMAYSTTIDKEKWEALNNKTNEMLEATWMSAETPRININVDEKAKEVVSTEPQISVEALTPSLVFNESNIIFNNVNLGLAKRPETKIELEKHITALKVQPTGVGINPVVDAKISIADILAGKTSTEGINSKLKVIGATRTNRGFWEIETDVEEIMQGAGLEVEYTYVFRNVSDKDYLSNTLVNKYEELTKNADNADEYAKYLKDEAKQVRKNIKAEGFNKDIGTYLGQFYYNNTVGENDKDVSTRVETMQDFINNSLKFENDIQKATYSGADFEENTTSSKDRKIYNTAGEMVDKTVETIINNSEATEFLVKDGLDFSKKVKLTRTLDVNEMKQTEGITVPTYLGEVVKYTNAAGRRDMEASPESLQYVHSDDNEITLNSYSYVSDKDGKTNFTVEKASEGSDKKTYEQLSEKEEKTAVPLNELDEFWGETITITKPTGEDRAFPTMLVIAVSTSAVLLGAGIILIKKFVLKKEQ